jgi:hypothetical protein
VPRRSSSSQTSKVRKINDQLMLASRAMILLLTLNLEWKDDATAQAKFQEISEAYYVLSEPNKRQIYDQYREEGLRFDGPPPRSQPSQGGESPSGGFHGFNSFGGTQYQFTQEQAEEFFRSFFAYLGGFGPSLRCSHSGGFGFGFLMIWACSTSRMRCSAGGPTALGEAEFAGRPRPCPRPSAIVQIDVLCTLK